MLANYLLIFLPPVILSKKDAPVIVPETDIKVCEYFDARIVRLREMVKELRQDVDIGSDLYKTLEESKLCDTVGLVAIPECAANNEGDECAAKKTQELIKKPLRHAIQAEKIKKMPSGVEFFAYCKHIGYKNVLKTFKITRSLMSAECGLPGQGSNRKKRNTELLPALLLAGSYDPSSIWFQYFLCKDMDLYCYFFTQGWTEGQYGQYYLYSNVFDDTTGIFAGATDATNLGTIALLGGLGGGLGGGYGQPSGYYPAPAYGAHPAPAPGRKRRSEDDETEEEPTRKRRECTEGDGKECRKRRNVSINCEEDPNHESCVRGDRKQRRSTKCVDGMPGCEDKKRKRRDSACDDCRLNNDSLSCDKCGK